VSLPSLSRGATIQNLRTFVPITKAEKLAYSTNTNPDRDSPANGTDLTTTGGGIEGIEDTEKDKMASDEDYTAFLDKANEDPNKGVAKSQTSGKIQLKAVDHGVEVPAGLKKATKDAFYISDADEPFEPVCLKHKGKTLPDEGRPSLPFQFHSFPFVSLLLGL
jgi:hypothetical protein